MQLSTITTGMEKRMGSKGHRSAEEILAHIETYGVERKDTEKPVRDSRMVSRRNRRSRSHRMTLDLHGLHSDAASQKLRFALERCHEIGIRELLVIHGYGRHSDPSEGPVLKQLVRDLLSGDLRPKCRSFRTAPAKDGGEGATLVLLR